MAKKFKALIIGPGNIGTDLLMKAQRSDWIEAVWMVGAEDGIDLYKIMDVAEDLVVPMRDQPIRVYRDPLTLGYASVYSSSLLFAKRVFEKYGVRARDLLMELGHRGTVGGQEDMIGDLALTMSLQKS